MDKNVPTILKSLLQTSSLLGLPYSVLPYTTLNQKLNVQAAATLNPEDTLTMKYAVVGIGGLSVSAGADGVPFTTSIGHHPTDTGLFKELPFIVRPIDSDLGPIQRENYRLRSVITINGVNYFAYYAKVLDLSTATTSLEIRNVAPDGTVGISNYTPVAGSLTPIPAQVTPTQTVGVNGQYITASTKVDFLLTAQDFVELLNSAELIYGTQDRAVLSEIALCSGVDRSVTVTSGGVQATYTEAIAMQVMNFLATNFPAPSLNKGALYSFDIGHSEPLSVLL